MASPEEIKTIIAGMKAHYPYANISHDNVRAYIYQLKAIPYDVLVEATTVHGAEKGYFPPPSEIIEKVIAVFAKRDGVLSKRKAHRQLSLAVRKYGVATKSVSFDCGDKTRDFIMETVSQMGGWRAFCMNDRPDIQKNIFEKLYEQVVKDYYREGLGIDD